MAGTNCYCVGLGILVLVCSVVVTDAIRCYGCYGTGNDNECEKYKTYRDAMRGRRPEIKKNCTGNYGSMCSIQTFRQAGVEVSQVRDCSDGKTFSFNSSNNPVYKRLLDLQPNNETACVWDGGNMVCLTLCDSGDFCNGPQLEESGADVIKMNVVTLLILGILSWVVKG